MISSWGKGFMLGHGLVLYQNWTAPANAQGITERTLYGAEN